MKHSTGYNYKEGKPIAIAIENLQPISKEQSSETHAYPTDEKGEPIFELMPTDQAVEMLSEIGEYADGLVSTNVKSAKKAYDDAMQKKPKATSFNAIRAEIEAIKKEQAAAKARYDAWVAISKAMKAQKEQKPTEKFIEGMEKTKTMPNGTKLKGRYVLVSPDILIPSHNPMDGWKTTEGFPVNDKGQNINDRDYEHDKAAQQFTEQIGQNYGGQAVEQVPTISNEGIVYDGNGRVMAGQIAAANNTDADYMQTLRDNAASFGFTPEQIDAIPHARVVFMLDENLPYTTETFAQFNTQEKKTQSNTERAVANSKKLSEESVMQIASVIDEYKTIDSFFQSEKGTADVLKVLQDNGIIAPNEVAGMVDNGLLNASGREFLTSLLLGSVLEEQAIRQVGIMPQLKNTILRAIKSIIANRQLKEFALTEEISNAISLLYEAKKANIPLVQYLRQTNMFEENAKDRYSAFEIELASAMDMGVDMFRNMLNEYNHSAENEVGGQIDIFVGKHLTKEDLKNLILKRHEQRRNQEKSSEAEEVGSADQGVQEGTRDGTAETETAGREDSAGEEVGRNPDEVVAEGEKGVNTNPTEAQKEAGNYKMGHVKIDGYDITIENPKGSVRSKKDANGHVEWSVTMNNTYGYIRGTEGVDGDHIDVFLSDNPEEGDVFVVDQIKEDGTFDEHKVMYGFASELDAEIAYLANYTPGWKGLGRITRVSKEDFKKWIESSHRKTKPFAEYAIAKRREEQTAAAKSIVDDAIGNTLTHAGKTIRVVGYDGDGKVKLVVDGKEMVESLGIAANIIAKSKPVETDSVNGTSDIDGNVETTDSINSENGKEENRNDETDPRRT